MLQKIIFVYKSEIYSLVYKQTKTLLVKIIKTGLRNIHKIVTFCNKNVVKQLNKS